MGERAPEPRAPPPAPPPGPRTRLQHGPIVLLLVLLNIFAAALGHGHGTGCDLDACTRAYDVSLESRGLAGPEGSAAFCGVLYDFGMCMFNIRSACRGNLNYHTSNSMLIHLKSRFDCARRLEQAGSPTGFPPRKHPRPTPAYTTTTPRPERPATGPGVPAMAVDPECSYHGSRAFKHCGLFGDPHLKTFRGTMQTCRVQGAWPLVDNPYLAVQVTNEHVLPDSPATATTKVTVLVKSSSTPCTPQKTYEATADAPLADTFIDGTNKSGPGEAVVIRHQETAYGASVEIYIRYIETTVIVRKVGRYLAFSTRMPEELVSWRSSGEDGDVDVGDQQLCVQGCPLSERMDLATDRGHMLSWADALAKCVAKTAPGGGASSESSSADTNEVVADLTDQYLDWCVFDLMTTGRDDFVLAARSAHRDTLTLDPGALRNRTTAQVRWDVGPGAASSTESAGPRAHHSPAVGILAALCLLLACCR